MALIESLVATMLLALIGGAVLAGVFSAIKVSALHREMANAEVVARNYVDALTSAPYVPCAASDSYLEPPSFTKIPGYEIEMGQTDASKPTVEYLIPGSDPPAFGSDCNPVLGSGLPDTGLQRVWFKVVHDRGSGPEVLRAESTVKPYDGTVDTTLGEVPGGGVRCTVTAGQDASLSEADPTTPDGISNTMNVSGSAGARHRSLVKIPLVPGSTPCAEGGTVPTGMQVRSAALRLYTWQVKGAVDCATDCWHVLKRNTSPWVESSVTWATPLSVTASAGELFQHGTGTGDFGPRFQLVTGPSLTADVATFYVAPSVNNGWSIDQACPPDYPGRTCTPDSAFRMRTREWTNAEQRPQLSVVFGPSITASKQIRNIGFGTCASVFDDEGHNGGLVVAEPCAGKGWQAWNIDSYNRFVGLNTVDNCMETGQMATGKPDVIMWDCDGPDGGVYDAWQMWTVDGVLIKYSPDPSKCLEIRDGNPAIGTRLTIADCNATLPQQQWAVEPLSATPAPAPPVRLRNVAGNNCADQDIKATDNGPIKQNWVQGFPCLGPDRSAQSFVPMPDGRLVSVANTSLCLDGTSGNAGAQITLDGCHQGANQQWIQETGGRIRNLKNNQCLEGGTDAKWFRLRACDASKPEQQWVVEPDTSAPLADVGQLRNVSSGACVEPLAVPVDGLDVIEVPCDQSRREQQFVRLTNGEFRATVRLSKCLQIYNGNNNSVLEFWTCDQMPDGNNPTNTHQQFDSAPTGQGLFKNRKNGYCVQGGVAGAKPKTQTCDNTLTAQQWEFGAFGDSSMARQLRNVGRGSCLEGVNNSSDGAAMWPCSGDARPSQQIAVVVISESGGVQTATLRKVDSINTCLDVQSYGDPGARSKWKDCADTDYQRWLITPTATPGEVLLKLKAKSTRCITGTTDESLATMQDCAEGNNTHRWVIEAPSDNRSIVQIRNKGSDGCLDVRGAMASGTRLTDNSCLGPSRPTQAFLRLNNNSFVSMVDASLCLDRNGDGNADAQLLMWGCNRSAAQRFTTTGDVLKHEGNLCEQLSWTGWNNVSSQTCVTSGTGKDYQTWYVEPVGVNGSHPVQFRNVAGWCVDVTVGFDGNTAQVIPCLGPQRLNQAFVSSPGGLLRLVTDPSMCLDSGGAGVGQALFVVACSTSGPDQDQTWTMEGGRLRNIRGATLSKCAEGWTEGNRVTMADCVSGPQQQIVKEDAGLSPKPGAVGHLRVPSTDSCLETEAIANSGNQPSLRSYPCVDRTRVQQLLVLLANGQIRPFSDLSRCVDANNGAEGEGLFATGCSMPATRVAQQFDRDATGLRTRAVNGGVRRCVEAISDGAKVVQRICDTSKPEQQWAFQAVTP